MKKILLFAAAIVLIQSANAQFCLRPGGMYVCDSEDMYIVKEFKDLKKEDIYKRAKTALISMYKSAKAHI